MSGSRFRYFVSADKIKQCFLELEQKRKIKYIKNKIYLTKDLQIYHSINEISNLGINVTRDQLGEQYTVMDEKYEIFLYKYKTKNGIIKYCVYEGMNPNSITIRFNGFYGDDC